MFDANEKKTLFKTKNWFCLVSIDLVVVHDFQFLHQSEICKHFRGVMSDLAFS